jgi:hypothetical protein
MGTRHRRLKPSSWRVFKPGNDMEASRPIGRGFLVLATGLLVTSAHVNGWQDPRLDGGRGRMRVL